MPHDTPSASTPEFASLEAVFSRLDPDRSLILTDEILEGICSASLGQLRRLIVPRGEAAKTWGSLRRLFAGMSSVGVDRGWTLYALGGGSVSDLGGFAASTWMRGIGFAALPTTLLSMVDASLGGKNGIDFYGSKNLIGTFRIPDRIVCDLSLLAFLDPVQFASGMAEAVKHAIIGGEAYFSLLESCLEKGRGPEGFSHLRLDHESLRSLVEGSQRIKLDIVGRDPREAGERRILNLGHSFGHGIEMATGIPHGHAVSLGITFACALSRRKGLMDADTEARLLGLLRGFGLPTDPWVLREPAVRKKVVASLGGDKKRYGDSLHFVLPEAPGKVEVIPLLLSDLRAFFEEELG
ncbi:MAG TPA: 3-dehydroquinate synthase family protein [Rectinemataceae bacterium]